MTQYLRKLDVLWEYAVVHPAFTLTGILGYLSLLGLIYEMFLLRAFGLDVLDYFSTSDFLFAFLKSVPALGVLLVIYVVQIPFALLVSQKLRSENTFLQRVVGLWRDAWRGELLMSFVASFIFAGAAGHLFATQVMKTTNFASTHTTCVTLKNNDVFQRWSLFASSSSYLFFFNKEFGTRVIMRSQVPKIEICNSN